MIWYFAKGGILTSELVPSRPKGIKDVTTGPLLRNIILFTVPLMLTGFLQLLFNAADLVVAGRMSGMTSLSAVGACSALINMIVNIAMGLSIGAGVAVAHDIGAGNEKSLREVISTSMAASVIFGIITAVIGFFFARPLLILMKTPDDVLAEAVPYMKAYFLGIPGCMIYNYAASMLRSSGDTARPLLFLSISGTANVFLNVLIVKMLGEGNGALSVGIATAVSQYIAMFEILIYMCRLKTCMRIDLKNLKIIRSQLWRIIKIGIPAGIQGTLFSISNVIIQSTVNDYGNIVIAGNTAAGNIEGFIYISMNSVYQTAVTFIGQHIGAKKYDKLNAVMRDCIAVVLVIGISFGIIAILFSTPLLRIYQPNNPEAVQAGLNRMRIICLTYFTCGLMDVGCGIMRGMGKSLTPMLVSLIGSCVFRIVWIYTVCPAFPTDIRVLYISYPISWVLTFSTHFIMIYFTKKKLIKSTC